jgi:septum formation protein
MRIILASMSPRRKELLAKVLKTFEVIPSKFDESKLKEEDPAKFAVRASYEKAKDVLVKNPDAIVIGADTIVVLDKKIMGKPKDIADAHNMLRSLSGKTHKVITGITVAGGGREISGKAETLVTFKKLSDDEIKDYVIDFDVMDKAGSYAIQDIGDKFVTKIDGDNDNVVGLPTKMVKDMLRLFQ